MPIMEPEQFLALDMHVKDTLLNLTAVPYVIVCKGIELSSGAIRNQRPDVMKKAFASAGYPEDVWEQKFGGMLRALSFGAPPHGGIAPGIDFFFQAEDGIRDYKVTGVQTCALPI